MGSKWYAVEFPEKWREYSIAFRELYPIVIALYLFARKMSNHKILFHSDNQSVVSIINEQTSRDLHIMRLVRQLVLTSLKFNIKFRAVHIPGVENYLADAISRFQVTEGDLGEYRMDRAPVTIPEELLPPNWTGM